MKKPHVSSEMVGVTVPVRKNKNPKNWHSALTLVMTGLLSLTTAGPMNSRAHAQSGEKPTARGLVIAKNVAVLSAQTSAKILKLPFRENEYFKAGDVLVKFDCALADAQLISAKADLRSSMGTLRRTRELKKFNAAGAHELSVAQANADKLKAEVEAAKVLTSRCVVSAPFSGQVIEQLVNKFESPSLNAPMLKIVDHTDLELSLITPAAWSQWMQEGTKIGFKAANSSKSHQARITRIGQFVDASSQTIKVIAAFTGTTQGMLAGMAGIAEFPEVD